MDIYNVSAGIVSSGITLASYDEMNVLSGGAAVGTSIGAGAICTCARAPARRSG